MGKELHAAVASPMGKDDLYLFVQKCGVELRNFSAGGRQFGDRSLIDDFEPQLLQVHDAVGEVFPFLNQPAWRNRVYGLQQNLHWGNWAISAYHLSGQI